MIVRISLLLVGEVYRTPCAISCDEPERNELRVEAKSTRLGVCDAGEMLEANEGDCPAIDHQLAGIGGADADHEHDVDVGVDLEERLALVFGVSRETSRRPFARASCEGPSGQRERRISRLPRSADCRARRRNSPSRPREDCGGCRSSGDMPRCDRCCSGLRRSQAAG